MDHAVALVQAYLQLNGYFTSAEYPIIASAGRSGARTITDRREAPRHRRRTK